MSGQSFDLDIHIDRYDKGYLHHLAELLSEEKLGVQAQLLQPNEKHYQNFEKRVVIKFCGLSGLSIIGGTEKLETPRDKIVQNFLDLISNRNGIVTRLNEKYKTYIDVKLLFAYPFSDFMYDIMQAENTRQEGFSISCQRNKKKYEYDFRTTQRLTYLNMTNSRTYQHLLNSLDKIQEAVNEGGEIINSTNTPNRVIVKFCPINISACLLKINHNIFLDPYVLSKQEYTERNLALIAPVSRISIPEIPLKFSGLNEKEKKIYEHYCSLVNHFRYLWYNPLTLYSTDATEYNKGENDTLRIIKQPKSVSYLAKADHLERLQKGKHSKADIDLWKQHCKNELLRHCSKFIKTTKDYQTGPQSPGKININPISIFIVGSWKDNRPSDFMNKLEEFFRKYFSVENTHGLKLNPIKINAENSTDFRSLIFEGLNSSQLAIVVQTSDLEDLQTKHYSRPNVYIEKGYLMGRLGKKSSRTSGKEDHEPVFVFIEDQTEDGSDTNHITQTRFANLIFFEWQFFKIVKWLWEITEINSNYALQIISDFEELFKKEIKKKIDPNRVQILGEFLELSRHFKRQIITWDADYNVKMKKLKA